MRNIHKTQVHARCPHQPVWDYYEVRVRTSGILRCEDFQSACDELRGQTLIQEDLTTKPAQLISQVMAFNYEFEVEVRGCHGQNGGLRTVVIATGEVRQEGVASNG